MSREAINKAIQLRYDELMQEGKHGHYETLFKVVPEQVQARAEEKDKRIAELTAQNKDLVEALEYIHSYMNEVTPKDVNSLMFDIVEHTIKYTEQALAKTK